MCGIVAYKGASKCLPFILDGLKSLEYRGYDSAGVSLIIKDSLVTIKQAGSIDDLKASITNLELSTCCAIGHTRWATHGKPCKRNSHPPATKDTLYL